MCPKLLELLRTQTSCQPFSGPVSELRCRDYIDALIGLYDLAMRFISNVKYFCARFNRLRISDAPMASVFHDLDILEQGTLFHL